MDAQRNSSDSRSTLADLLSNSLNRPDGAPRDLHPRSSSLHDDATLLTRVVQALPDEPDQAWAISTTLCQALFPECWWKFNNSDHAALRQFLGKHEKIFAITDWDTVYRRPPLGQPRDCEVAMGVADDEGGRKCLGELQRSEEAPARVQSGQNTEQRKRRRRRQEKALDLRKLSRVTRRGKRPGAGEAARRAAERAAAEEADRKEASMQREREEARIMRKKVERADRRAFLAAVSEREAAQGKGAASEAGGRTAETGEGPQIEGEDKGCNRRKRRKRTRGKSGSEQGHSQNDGVEEGGAPAEVTTSGHGKASNGVVEHVERERTGNPSNYLNPFTGPKIDGKMPGNAKSEADNAEEDRKPLRPSMRKQVEAHRAWAKRRRANRIDRAAIRRQSREKAQEARRLPRRLWSAKRKQREERRRSARGASATAGYVRTGDLLDKNSKTTDEVVTKVQGSPAQLSQAPGDTALWTRGGPAPACQPADVSTFAPATSMTRGATQACPPSPDPCAGVQNSPPTPSNSATLPSDADVSRHLSPSTQPLAPALSSQVSSPSVCADAAAFTPPADDVGSRHADPSVRTALSIAHADGSIGSSLAGAASRQSVQTFPPACGTAIRQTESSESQKTLTLSPVEAAAANLDSSPPTSSSPLSTRQGGDAQSDPPHHSAKLESCASSERPDGKSGEDPGGLTAQLLLRHGGLATRTVIRVKAEGSISDLWTAIEEVLVPGVRIADIYAIGNGRMLSISETVRLSSKGLGDGSQVELQVKYRGGGRGEKKKRVPVKEGPMDKFLRPKPVIGKKTLRNDHAHQDRVAEGLAALTAGDLSPIARAPPNTASAASMSPRRLPFQGVRNSPRAPLSPAKSKRARHGTGQAETALNQLAAETAVETTHVPDSVEGSAGVESEFSDSLGRLSLDNDDMEASVGQPEQAHRVQPRRRGHRFPVARKVDDATAGSSGQDHGRHGEHGWEPLLCRSATCPKEGDPVRPEDFVLCASNKCQAGGHWHCFGLRARPREAWFCDSCNERRVLERTQQQEMEEATRRTSGAEVDRKGKAKVVETPDLGGHIPREEPSSTAVRWQPTRLSAFEVASTSAAVPPLPEPSEARPGLSHARTGTGTVRPSTPPAGLDELEREAHRLGQLPLVRGLVRLLEEGRRDVFLDALRDIAFLAGDGALRKDGVDLGTKSSDWPIHLSVFRTAQALGYLSADAEPHLVFGFQVKEAGGIARAWELCTSGIASPEFAQDILAFISTDVDNKGERYLLPSPLALAMILPGCSAGVIHTAMFGGLYQAEGCVSPHRPSQLAKYPYLSVSSVSGRALYGLKAANKALLGIEGGNVQNLLTEYGTGRTLNVGSGEDSDDEEEDLEPCQKLAWRATDEEWEEEGEEEEDEGDDAEEDAEKDRGPAAECRLDRIALLREEARRKGLTRLVRVVEEWERREKSEVSGSTAAAGSGERYGSGTGGGNAPARLPAWTKNLARRLAEDVADEFFMSRPVTYCSVIDLVLDRLEGLWRADVPGDVSTNKFLYTLAYKAIEDVAAAVPFVVLGTRLAGAVLRKLLFAVQWSTGCQEVGLKYYPILREVSEYRGGSAPFLPQQFRLEGGNCREREQSDYEMLKANVFSRDDYMRRQGITSSSSFQNRMDKREQQGDKYKHKPRLSNPVYWQQRATLFDATLAERVYQPPASFYDPSPPTPLQIAQLRQRLLADPSRLAAFLRCAGADFSSRLPVSTAQASGEGDGAYVYLLARTWVTKTVTWLRKRAIGPPPNPSQHPTPPAPFAPGTVNRYCVVSPSQLRILECALGEPGAEAGWMHRGSMQRIPVRLGVGRKAGTVAELRPVAVRFEHGRPANADAAGHPPPVAVQTVELSDAATVEQLRALSKELCTGAPVDLADNAATADWTAWLTVRLNVPEDPLGSPSRPFRPAGITRELPFNWGNTLRFFIQKKFPMADQGNGVQLTCVGCFGDPEHVPPIPREALAALHQGEAPLADPEGGVETEAWTWVARVWKTNRAILSDLLERGGRAGLGEVELPDGQLVALKRILAQKSAKIKEAAMGSWTKEKELLNLETPGPLRSFEHTLTWEQAASGLDFWRYGKDETNALERGGKVCRKCGRVSLNGIITEPAQKSTARKKPAIPGCEHELMERSVVEERICPEPAGGGRVVKWDTSNAGRSVTAVREYLMEIGLCERWDPTAPGGIKRRPDKRVFYTWLQSGESGDSSPELLPAPTARLIAALFWQLYTEALAEPQ